MENRYIWGIDSSLFRTGISIFSNDGTYIKSVSIETSAKETHAQRLKLIATKILELKKEYPLSVAVFEQGFIRYNKSSQAIYKVLGVIEYVLWDVPHEFFPPGTVKKAVGERGNIKKKELSDIIFEKYNISFANFDESDSFSVALCYLINKRGVLYDGKKDL